MTNVAAISYHFGDKLGLYKAVIEFGVDLGRKLFPLPNREKDEDPQRFLCRQVESLLQRIKKTSGSKWYEQIVKREMLFPKKEVGDLIGERCVKPDYNMFYSSLLLIEPNASQKAINNCIFYLIAILSFQATPASHFKKIIVSGPERKNQETKEIAQSITSFVVAGLRDSVSK